MRSVCELSYRVKVFLFGALCFAAAITVGYTVKRATSSRNNSNSKNSNNNRHIRRTSSLKSIEQLNIWKNLTEASHVLSDHEDNSNEEQHGEYKNDEIARRTIRSQSIGGSQQIDTSFVKIGDQGMQFLTQALIHLQQADHTAYIHLQEINLSFSNIGDNGVQTLTQVLRITPNVVILNLSHNSIGHKGAKAISDVIDILTKLRMLDLSDNHIGDEGAKSIGRMVSQNQSILELNLASNRIGAKGAGAFCECLQLNHTLMSLSLNSNDIGEQGMRQLSIALATNVTLKELMLNSTNTFRYIRNISYILIHHSLTCLHLSDNSIGERVRELFDALQRTTTLHTLDLSFNKINDSAVVVIAEVLRTNQSIMKLDLSNNQIGKGSRALLESLNFNGNIMELNLSFNRLGDCHYELMSNNVGLLSLDLSHNDIGERGGLSLEQLLRGKNCALTVLNLSQNHLGDMGAHYLASALSHNNNLTELTLCENKIGDKGVLELVDAVKTCCLGRINSSNSNSNNGKVRFECSSIEVVDVTENVVSVSVREQVEALNKQLHREVLYI